MAKDLQTGVILETKTAEAKLRKLVKAINNVDNAIKKSESKSSKLAQTLQLSVNKLNTIEKKTNDVVAAQRKVNNEVKRTNSSHKGTKNLLNEISSKLKRLASTYLGIMGMGAMIKSSDTITKSENKLNSINNGDTAATQAQMDAMYAAAQRSRTGYADMLTNVSKSMTLAPDAFGGDMNKAIAFQEIMGKSYALGGASAAEQSSSMYQMIQSLGSGKLAGDELRSVTEGAPLAAKQIEKFAQEIYKTDAALKDMGADGMITSEIVVAAMLNAGDEIDKKFQDTAMTFEQAWTNIKNTALKSFEPVLQKLNELLNSDAGKAIGNGIVTAIQIIAKAAMWLFTIVEQVYNFIANNWEVISDILLTIATVIAAVLIPQLISLIYHWILTKINAIASAMAAFTAWMLANLPLFILIAVIAIVVIALIWLSDSFAQACGYVVGVLMAAISVIWNIFIMLLEFILKTVLLPLLQAWDNFANFFGNLFNDPIAAIIHAFEGLADTVLSILHTIAKGIDAIFGSNLAKTVQGWRDGLASKADELANKYGNGTYEEKSNLADQFDTMLSDASSSLYWNTGDAYNTGYGWGEAGGQWMTDKLGSLGSMGDMLGESGGGLDLTDTNGLLGDIAGSGEDTAGNTGKMADSMALATEDLELLYDLAEMEWKKEFTTANITVDMSNYNTVNGMSDLDGIATYLRDGLIEEMSAVANGAYAF